MADFMPSETRDAWYYYPQEHQLTHSKCSGGGAIPECIGEIGYKKRPKLVRRGSVMTPFFIYAFLRLLAPSSRQRPLPLLNVPDVYKVTAR